jgi:DNA-binding GntR family transcriptional regulator
MRKALDKSDPVAYRKLDAEFHRAFFDHSGNVYLLASYLGIAFRIQALRSRLSADPMLNRSSFTDHEKILKLVETGKIDAALQLLSKHVGGTTEDYAATIDARRNAKAS